MFQSRLIAAIIAGLLIPSVILAQDCPPEECLWPGDANRNGICNNMDFLWFGLAIQDELGGPFRQDAVVSWTPQPPPSDWPISHPISNINYKYADTNGDGWIDGGDMTIYPDLYGQTNDQFTTLLGTEIPGDDLFLEFSNSTPAPGETVEVSIHLGSSNAPINDLYGIAFTIEYDTAIVIEEFTNFSDIGGWLDVPEVNLFKFTKVNQDLDILNPEFAFVSRTGEPQSGFGEICKMNIVIEDVIVSAEGIPMDSVELRLNFKRVLGINAFEEDMMITVDNAEILVHNNEINTQNRTPKIITKLLAQQLLVQSSVPIETAELVDMSGKTFYRRELNCTKLEIMTAELPAGIYVLRVKTKDGIFLEKMSIIQY